MIDRPADPGRIVFGEEFHDGFHYPWQCRREGYPRGAWRRHLAYQWEFYWSSELRRVTVCRLGRHRRSVATKRHADGTHTRSTLCADCLRGVA